MRRRMVAMLAALAVATAACGSSDEAAEETAGYDGETAAYEEGPTDGMAYGDEEAMAEGGAAPGDDVARAAPATLALGAPLGRKVIRNADLELEVEDANAAVRRITDVVESAGGFVAGAELYNEEGYGLLGSLTLRVPTERMTSTLTAIEDVAVEVRSRSMGSQDVTEQYADIEAQLRNLRALEVELLDLLSEIREKSTNANEILTVFERIRQVRAEIEQLQGRMQVLDDLVGLATIQVRLVPTPSPTPIVAEDGWKVGDVVRDALRSTVTALQSVANVVIWLALTALPVLAVLALPAAAVWFGFRRMKRDDAEPTAEAPATP